MAMTISMQQSGAWSTARGTNLLDTGVPFYDVYETADGRWMSVGGLEPQFWDATVAVLADAGFADLPDRNDPAQWPALRTRLAEIFATRSQAQWDAVFAPTDACVAPVVPLDEAYRHPHLADRGTYVEQFGVTQPAPAPRFSATPTSIHRPPERPGASTRQALTDWGIDDVDDLIRRGIAVPADPEEH